MHGRGGRRFIRSVSVLIDRHCVDSASTGHLTRGRPSFEIGMRFVDADVASASCPARLRLPRRMRPAPRRRADLRSVDHCMTFSLCAVLDSPPGTTTGRGIGMTVCASLILRSTVTSSRHQQRAQAYRVPSWKRIARSVRVRDRVGSARRRRLRAARQRCIRAGRPDSPATTTPRAPRRSAATSTSPMPEPCGFVVKNGTNRFVALANPGPSSSTMSDSVPLCRVHRMRTPPFVSSDASTALRTRLINS